MMYILHYSSAFLSSFAYTTSSYVKEYEPKRADAIMMKNNIFWFILGSRSAPFLSLSFEENIYFWR